MAYVPGFKYDIFISYPMEAEKWTAQFVQALQTTSGSDLAPLRDLKFYFAKDNWQLGQISDEMLEAVRQSALFLAVLTKDSIFDAQSRFLARELKAFRESGNLNGRFCPIPLHPVPGAELSKLMPLDNAQAFWNKNLEFYFESDSIPIWLEPSNEQRAGDYNICVVKASWYLRKRLDEQKSRGSESGTAEKKGPFSGKSVLLARKEPDVEREWNDIRELLLNDGVNLLADDGAGGGAFDFDAALQRADLFVQLLSPLDPTETAKAQLAAVEARGSIPILQWRRRINNPKLLDGMADGDRKLFDGSHVIAGGPDEFKRAIREKLKELAQRRLPVPKRDKPYLYITANSPDLQIARAVQVAARKYTVADVMSEDKSERRKDFAKGLKQAAGVIFLYGDADRQFIDRWLKEYIRATRLLNVYPKVAALYQAPPKKKAEEEPLVPFDELRTIGSQEKFNLGAVEQICAELCCDRN